MTDNLRLTPAALGAIARGDIANAIVAATPGGIEAQEAAGQRQMASSFRTLPKDMDRAPAEIFGFKFLADADDLFVNVLAPEGWAIRPTDHSMNSDIVDDKGRVRGGIFYKAAFYDRSANGHWRGRYRLENEYGVDYRVTATKAVDTATGETLFSIPIPTGGGTEWERREIVDKTAAAQLAERFPDFRDVTAYWDEA
jgi:hypothetical protein